MRKKLFLDLFLFIFIILVMNYSLTGNLFHEIIGIILFILFIFHNILNVKWIKIISKKIFKERLKKEIIIKYILNVLLWISLLLVTLSGILISGIFNINIAYELLVNIHLISAYFFFIVTMLHILLHINEISTYLSSKLNIGKNFIKMVIIIIVIISLLLCLKDMILKVKKNLDNNTNSSNNNGSSNDNGNSSNDNSTNPPMTLTEYLSTLNCSNCHNHCPLSNIRCSRGESAKEKATEAYYDLYGENETGSANLDDTIIITKNDVTYDIYI